MSALRYHFLQRGEIKVFRNTLFILLAATLAGYIFNVVTINALLGILAMILLIAWVFWYMLPLSTYNKAATFKDQIRLNYSEEGMMISTRTSEHQRLISWSNFTQVVEAKKFFFLYRGKKSFFLIPTSAFKTEADKNEFGQLLKTKIP